MRIESLVSYRDVCEEAFAAPGRYFRVVCEHLLAQYEHGCFPFFCVIIECNVGLLVTCLLDMCMCWSGTFCAHKKRAETESIETKQNMIP